MIKIKKRKILLLPGDGIGPEVISEVKKIIAWLNKNKSLDFEIEEALEILDFFFLFYFFNYNYSFISKKLFSFLFFVGYL